MKFALVGNQNCGKTTLFNRLTGSNQHVGNFPGVTVESKTGQLLSVKDAFVVDLPGIYSLRPYTADEEVARDFILTQKPDCIINIVDATNIERNLYLTTQLLAMGVPIVIALNMMDEVRANGGTVDIAGLSEMLGCKAVPVSAAKNEGIGDLVEAVVKAAKNKIMPAVTDFCSPGSAVHRAIHSTMTLIEDHAENIGISARFCAMNLITTGGDFATRLQLDENEKEMLEHGIVEMESETGLDRDAAIADSAYTFIESVCDKCVKKCKDSKERRHSEKIDAVLTGKYTAVPFFILIMASVFVLTFQVIGKFFGDLIALGLESLGGVVVGALNGYGINPAVADFLEKGLFGGLGAVVSLLPYIVIMFLFLSLLEDSGYMARVAFIMDKPLRKIGLSGRSFVPIIVGFGCSVPAVMSTRTLASDRDKKITIGLIPFVSCSAKAVVYSAVVACGLFSWWQQSLIIVALYLVGIALGLLAAALSGKILYKGNPVPFVMELPNYRLPSLKSVVILMWEKAKDFLSRAFTVIFLATLIVWFLQAYNAKLIFITADIATMGGSDSISLLAHLGNALAPIFSPIGLGDGRIVSALVAGFTAKEAVISTIEMLAGGDGLIVLLPTVAKVISFLSFVLLYTPCVAAVSAIKREFGSVGKTVALVVVQCISAWVLSFIVYNIAVLI